MSQLKTAVLSGLVIGTIFGVINALLSHFWGGPNGGFIHELVRAVIGGMIFGAVAGLYIRYKGRKNVQLTTTDGMAVIYAGLANHYVKYQGNGGKLYLLPAGLVFKSYNAKAKIAQLEISKDDIAGVTFANTYGLIPNGIKINKTDGTTEHFIVYHRERWKAEIDNLRFGLQAI